MNKEFNKVQKAYKKQRIFIVQHNILAHSKSQKLVLNFRAKIRIVLFGGYLLKVEMRIFRQFFKDKLKYEYYSPMAWRWRWRRFSSSELCEDDGSTSETPESAGLGGRDPGKISCILVTILELYYCKSLEILPLGWCLLLGCGCVVNACVLLALMAAGWGAWPPPDERFGVYPEDIS